MAVEDLLPQSQYSVALKSQHLCHLQMTDPDHHCAHRQGNTPPPVLLNGGCTAHSCFKIPIPCHEDSTCRIKKNSHGDEILLQTGVIIWDDIEKLFAAGLICLSFV